MILESRFQACRNHVWYIRTTTKPGSDFHICPELSSLIIASVWRHVFSLFHAEFIYRLWTLDPWKHKKVYNGFPSYRLDEQSRSCCSARKWFSVRHDVPRPAAMRDKPPKHTAISPNKSSDGDELGDKSGTDADYLFIIPRNDPEVQTHNDDDTCEAQLASIRAADRNIRS